jgi:hypothetical protein
MRYVIGMKRKGGGQLLYRATDLHWTPSLHRARVYESKTAVDEDLFRVHDYLWWETHNLVVIAV